MEQRVRLGVGFRHSIVLAVAMLVGGLANGQTINDVTISSSILCNGGTTGEITIVASGENLSYKINSGDYQSSNVFSGLSANTYTVYVRENEGSPVTQDITLSEPDAITFNLTNTRDFYCDNNDELKGAFTVNLTGGTNPTATVENSAFEPQDPTSTKIIFTYIGPEVNNYQLMVTSDNSARCFTTTDGTPLTFWYEGEIVAGTHVFWVLIPTVYNGANELFMLHRNTYLPSTIDEVMIAGGLNATVYDGVDDFSGNPTSTCNDTYSTPLNRNLDNGQSVCSSSNGTRSIRWEGWFLPPASAYYGVTVNGTVEVKFNEDQVISVSDGNSTTMVSTFSSVNPVRIQYDYSNGDDEGNITFMYNVNEPDDDTDYPSSIPVANFYYREIVDISPLILQQERYDQLAADIYTITADGNGCPDPDPKELTFTVTTDDEPPTFVEGDFPADVQYEIGAYNDLNVQDKTVLDENFTDNSNNWVDDPTENRLSISNGLNYTAIGSPVSDFITLSYSTSYLNTIRLELTATQSGTGWDEDDYLKISVSYDGTVWEVPDFEHFNGIDGGNISSGTITLPVDADRNPNFKVRISFHTEGVGRNYEVTNFKIIGNEVIHTIAPVYPEVNDDRSGALAPTYVDQEPDWCNYDAANPANNEFSINRDWTVTDYCGKTTQRTQRISVGTAPELDVSANDALILDWCNNTPEIAAPGIISDNCTANGDATISWIITEGATELANGTGAISGVEFPDVAAPDAPAEKIYNIEWTATDGSGMKSVYNQQVTVLKRIAGTLTGEQLDNVCKNEDVVFTLSDVSGGTGSYTYSFTPAGGNWVVGDMEYTINWGEALAGVSVSVVITDVENTVSEQTVSGGCSSTIDISSPFTVHENISTGVITREP